MSGSEIVKRGRGSEEEAETKRRKRRRLNVENAAEEEAEANKRRHLKVVFLGPSEAGKSTIVGQILLLTGQVDDQEMQKYKEEAKENGREGCYLAYTMDTDEYERRRGTVQVGKAMFDTSSCTFTILDVPGLCTGNDYRSISPDVAVLVISARRDEFETGFQEGGEMEMVGQTREHVQIARGLGVSSLIVVLNKMDDPTVMWSKDRYDEIKQEVLPFLESFRCGTINAFLPISGLLGINMDKGMDEDVCPWWRGPTLFEALDSVEFVRLANPNGPFRMPIFSHYKDEETVVMGNVESGCIREGDFLSLMPNQVPVEVIALYCDGDIVDQSGPRDSLIVYLRGIEDEDIVSGYVLSSLVQPIRAPNTFLAHLEFLKQPQNTIFYAGYKAVLHTHAMVEECEITEMIPPGVGVMYATDDDDDAICRIQVDHGPICMEAFSHRLGRFVLRCGRKTIAVGYVV
ncbi:unnamed protein product [Thlaspi arvense]|uniref:Uncharacterized protein n=1 Tax=Thlaspi arvense TaxID=13288 RepID=A0AAU9T6A0_THLAR|nr:unnamed protein product [Thlaspi arvense]